MPDVLVSKIFEIEPPSPLLRSESDVQCKWSDYIEMSFSEKYNFLSGEEGDFSNNSYHMGNGQR
jgi:hypothetical protein